jgi:ring-1,2-phenylacetyl-CoA epoxidase subunit PaaE
MNNKNHTWLLHQVKVETEDAITIFFDTQGALFKFQAGQFINISMNINGEKVSRSYSLSSSPADDKPSITVKRVKGGLMSNYLFAHARSITEWDIEGPYGNFVMNEAHAQEELVFLGAGSGITPLYSMIAYLSGYPRNSATLIYANRNREDIIFSSSIKAREADGRLKVFHALSGENIPEGDVNNLYKGRLNRLIVKKLVKQLTKDPVQAKYFICGPEQLMITSREALTSIGVPGENIFTESFFIKENAEGELTLPKESHEVVFHYYEPTYQSDSEETAEVVQVTSLIDVKAGQSILEAAIENGMPVKHSCKTGTCGSCSAKYTEGSVNMLKNFALTDEEVNQKYILLCQSYPLDDQVIIETA